MVKPMHKKLFVIIGSFLLFGVMAWILYLHLPTLKNGLLNAGDDHVHVAYSNELKRTVEGEGRILGWSRLYGMGAPIFLLRPPGFYVAVNAIHFLSGLSIEQSLKLVVLFGFCLFPLSVYWGARLLGLGIPASFISAMLSPLCISLWGHTIDAYQYLGVHKQLIAILIFPVAVGSGWRLLAHGTFGLLFAILFAVMFMTHPYIAYCFALNMGCMLLALFAKKNSDWEWKQGIRMTLLWLIPSVLMISFWLIPFVSSPEIQFIDPYLSRRYYFDVTGCTTAETLRQYFLGGILDTTRFSGPFGDQEWGWLENGVIYRFPILTALSFAGLILVLVRPENAVHRFIGFSFLLSFLLLAGPDDFPFLDWIPFAKQFQNIHAVFMLEWSAFMLGGLGLSRIISKITRLRKRYLKAAFIGGVAAFVLFGYGSAVYERTITGRKLADVRNVSTHNGEMVLSKEMNPQWAAFNNVVKKIKVDREQGNITGFPQEHEDSVLYNLLPLMVNRSVSICGFEYLGGVYHLMADKIRVELRDNYYLQKLFNIRFVVNNHFLRGKEMQWHENIVPLYRDKFWELVKVKGEFGDFQELPENFIGFTGSEREWQELMELWIEKYQAAGSSLPWIVNFTNSGLEDKDIETIKPYLKSLVNGKDAVIPDVFMPLGKKTFDEFYEHLKKWPADASGESILTEQSLAQRVNYKPLKQDRRKEIFEFEIRHALTPILFKRAFYRGWELRIDDNIAPIFRVSPGLQMFMAPRGRHLVQWQYKGPNNSEWTPYALISAVIISMVLICFERKRVRDTLRRTSEKPELHRVEGKRKLLTYLPAGIWALAIAVLLHQIVSEAYFKIPVVIHPRNGQTLDMDKKRIFWNPVVGFPRNRQIFRIEIAGDAEFKNVVYRNLVSETEHRPDFTRLLKGRYYYRVRLEMDRKTYPWTKPVRFIIDGA